MGSFIQNIEEQMGMRNEPSFDSQQIKNEEPVYVDTGIGGAQEVIDEEIGLQLTHLLALGGMFICVLILISLLWNYCAGDEQPPPHNETPLPEPKKLPEQQVTVAEVRPGLILIRGSPTSEETFRILQEYDAMTQQNRGVLPADILPQYGSMASRMPDGSPMNYPMHSTPPPPAGHQGPPPGVAPCRMADGTRLIDLDLDGGDARPPPYAPPFVRSENDHVE